MLEKETTFEGSIVAQIKGMLDEMQSRASAATGDEAMYHLDRLIALLGTTMREKNKMQRRAESHGASVEALIEAAMGSGYSPYATEFTALRSICDEIEDATVIPKMVIPLGAMHEKNIASLIEYAGGIRDLFKTAKEGNDLGFTIKPIQ